ncbi:porin [Hahella sp. CCB-MM4]|uniref:porin n=1 Tax=Hahella sp. (strain CCB-MM4) TaxID=1926491 RepID=UPI00143DE4A6|nr:porin [Hahella sp. CCB-MM4]
MKKHLKTIMLVSAAGMLPTIAAAQSFEIGNGWNADLGLLIQAFGESVDVDGADSQFRVKSGFDPSKLTLGLTAPEVDGLTVSGTYQVIQTLNDSGGDPNATSVRIAELAVSGDFGTFKAGRGWQIMGSSSLIHDTGSLPGVGGQCGFDRSGANGACGRIGYGYVWTDFAPGLQYASKSFGGVSFRAGVFEGQSKTDPRFEGEINYNSDMFDLWASTMSESSDSGDIKAFDVGGELRFGDAALTAAYTSGEGIGRGLRGLNIGSDTTFYYVEGDYTIDKTTLGVSYGAREEEGEAAQDEATLVMAFIHHKLTDNVTLVAEFNQEEVEAQDGSTTLDAKSIALGAQLVF